MLLTLRTCRSAATDLSTPQSVDDDYSLTNLCLLQLVLLISFSLISTMCYNSLTPLLFLHFSYCYPIPSLSFFLPPSLSLPHSLSISLPPYLPLSL